MKIGTFGVKFLSDSPVFINYSRVGLSVNQNLERGGFPGKAGFRPYQERMKRDLEHPVDYEILFSCRSTAAAFFVDFGFEHLIEFVFALAIFVVEVDGSSVEVNFENVGKNS